MMTRSARLFARLTRLFPRSVREEYGADMIATFLQRSAETYRRGRVHYALFIARELVDLVRIALTERIRARHDHHPRPDAIGWNEHSRRAVRHATRRLARTPGFTTVAVLTLSMAIGSASTVFTLVHRIVLSDLPYPAADRLIALDHTAPSIGLQSGIGMSIGVYRQYTQLPTIDAAAVYDVTEGTLIVDGTAERIQYLFTTPPLGGILGITPAIGRWFTEEEGVAGSPNTVVLSDAFWRRSFRGSPDAIGRTLQLDGRSYEIVGVLPGDFAFPDPSPQLVIPLPLPRVWERAAGFNYRGIARLAPRATIEDTRREQNAVIRDLARRYPSDPEARTGMIANGQLVSNALPYKQAVLGTASSALWVLLAAAAIMLVMACANLANLFLVRADSRHEEVILRRALGAGSGDIARDFVAESLVIAGLGGVVALGMVFIAINAIVASVAVPLPRLHDVRIDGAVVSFVVLTSIATGLLLGLVCVVRHVARRAPALGRVERAGTASRGRLRSRHALMGLQISLAVVLLGAAGLSIRSFSNLVRVDLGFRPDSALVFRVGLPRAVYRGVNASVAFHKQAMQRIAALPGVAGVALTSTLPLDGPGLGNPLEVFGAEARSADATPVARFRRVSESYFETLGVRLRDGRPLSDRATPGDVVVNEALAAAYFGNENPLGRRVRAMGEGGQDWLTIVGVVTNTVAGGLYETAATPQLYVALGDTVRGNLPAPQDVTYVVRVSGDPRAWVSTVRGAFAEVDARVPLWRPEAFTDVVARARATLSFALVLLVIAASVALVLGIVGVYAVIAYGVRQRGTEIGVRIALGATPGQVTRLIVRQSSVVVTLGVMAGVAASLVSAGLLRALLFGVAPTDAATHATTAGALFVVAMIACWVPARSAARLHPADALRGSGEVSRGRSR